MSLSEQAQAQFNLVKVYALVTQIALPVINLVLALILGIERKIGGEYDFVTYMLLIVALAQPLLIPVIERRFFNNYRTKQNTRQTPERLFASIGIFKYSFIEFIFLYGFAIYLISGRLGAMLYFYPIGAFWAWRYWPQERKMEQFLSGFQIVN